MEKQRKSRFRLITNPENCVGCRLCQMRCSFRFTKRFSFAESRIEVLWQTNGRRYEIGFNELCDSCGLCARSCMYEALTLQQNDEKGTGSI